jgi:hypothetical protein
MRRRVVLRAFIALRIASPSLTRAVVIRHDVPDSAYLDNTSQPSELGAHRRPCRG